MKIKTILALFVLLCLPAQAFAACSSPAGAMGYDVTGTGVYQYCDGTNWVAMGIGFDNGLLGHWALDEMSGTVAADAMGSNNGTMVGGLSGGDSVAGQVATGLNFDGINDYISIDESIYNSSDYTISTWFNISDRDINFQNALYYEGTNVDEDIYLLLAIRNGSSSNPYKMMFRLYDSTGQDSLYSGSGHTISKNI